MTDTSSNVPPANQAPPPPAPDPNAPPANQAPAPAPAAPAPALTLTGDDINAIAQQTAHILAGSTQVQAPPPPSPAAPPPPPSPENLFTKGQLVKLEWHDDYDGPESRYGIVVDTLPDEGEGAKSVVAWFHDVSAPIGDQILAAG